MSAILKLLDPLRTVFGVFQHIGLKDSKKHGPILPIGLSRVITEDYLSVGYIDADGNIRDMFVLEPGKHRVMCPSDVHVVIDCAVKARWSVRWPSRFNPADPTRVEASLVRPRSQREEMQDYVNERLAQVLAGENARKLRSGEAEIDFSQDNYDEDLEDDMDSPLSVYQLEGLVSHLERDLEHKRKAIKDLDTPPAKPAKPSKVPGPTVEELPQEEVDH